MAEGLEVATTAASLEQRSDLLWRWGNAWALAGHELPVRLPLVVQNVSQTAAPGRAATPALFREIDSYLRQLAGRWIRLDPQRSRRTGTTSLS